MLLYSRIPHNRPISDAPARRERLGELAVAIGLLVAAAIAWFA